MGIAGQSGCGGRGVGVIGGSRVWIIIGAGVCGWALQAGCNGRQGDVLSTKFKDCGQDLAADGASHVPWGGMAGPMGGPRAWVWCGWVCGVAFGMGQVQYIDVVNKKPFGKISLKKALNMTIKSKKFLVDIVSTELHKRWFEIAEALGATESSFLYPRTVWAQVVLGASWHGDVWRGIGKMCWEELRRAGRMGRVVWGIGVEKVI